MSAKSKSKLHAKAKPVKRGAAKARPVTTGDVEKKRMTNQIFDLQHQVSEAHDALDELAKSLETRLAAGTPVMGANLAERITDLRNRLC
jgi:hypothetical protein